MWIDHPASDSATGATTLEYAAEPRAPAGVTPLPPEVATAALRFTRADEPRLWLAFETAVELPFTVDARLPPPPVLVRCRYESPIEPRAVEDRPRIGGCVFATELRIDA